MYGFTRDESREREFFHKFGAVVGAAAAVGFEPTDRVFPAKVRPDQAIISRPH